MTSRMDDRLGSPRRSVAQPGDAEASRPPGLVVRLVRSAEALARILLGALDRRDLPALRPVLRLARNREFWRFVRFLATGGVNFAFSYTVFLIAHLLGASPTASVIVSWLLGVLFNFATTGRVVFGSGRIALLPRFIAVYVVQLGANIALLRALLTLDVPVPVAQALVVVGLAVATFFALRRFVFRPEQPTKNG